VTQEASPAGTQTGVRIPVSLTGPVGTLLTVVSVVVFFFSNPSTVGGNAAAYLPAFWLQLVPVLPPWNRSTLVRNTWRGTTRRPPISPGEVGGIAAIPPTWTGHAAHPAAETGRGRHHAPAPLAAATVRQDGDSPLMR
jgi:hypothetical protein